MRWRTSSSRSLSPSVNPATSAASRPLTDPRPCGFNSATAVRSASAAASSITFRCYPEAQGRTGLSPHRWRFRGRPCASARHDEREL